MSTVPTVMNLPVGSHRPPTTRPEGPPTPSSTPPDNTASTRPRCQTPVDASPTSAHGLPAPLRAPTRPSKGLTHRRALLPRGRTSPKARFDQPRRERTEFGSPLGDEVPVEATCVSTPLWGTRQPPRSPRGDLPRGRVPSGELRLEVTIHREGGESPYGRHTTP